MRRRLFIIAATALAPAVAILGYHELASRQQRMAEVAAETLSISRQAEQELARVVDGVAGILIATSKVPEVEAMAEPGCSRVLKSIAAATAQLASLIVTSPDGDVRCASTPTSAPINLGSRGYFRMALERNGLVVGGFAKGRVSGQDVLPIALPVSGSGATPRAVLLAGLRIDWLNAKLAERGIEKGNALTVADRDGWIVARYPYPERFVGTRIPEPFLSQVTADKPGVIEVTSQDGTERVLGYQPVGVGSVELYVSAGISKANAFERINRASVVAALMIVAGIVLSIAAGWFVGEVSIRRPIRRVVAVVTAWRNGDRTARTGMSAENGEVEQIGAALDDFLEELTRRQAQAEHDIQQRRLLMHELGHRVKNTLSIAVSLANQMFRGASGDVAAYSQRLGALASAYDLLLADDWNSADIRSVVEKALLPIIDDADGRLETTGVAVTLPSQLVLSLSLVLHELATNALKYGALSQERGQVHVSWTRDPERPQRITLVWRETDGPPVVPPEREGFGTKLLQRAFPSSAKSSLTVDFDPRGLVCTMGFEIVATEVNPLAPEPTPA
jgi:two-component sensor histidine kinase